MQINAKNLYSDMNDPQTISELANQVENTVTYSYVANQVENTVTHSDVALREPRVRGYLNISRDS